VLTILTRGSALLFLSAIMFSPANAATGQVIKAALEDSSTRGALSDMRITLDQDMVKAGRITFQAVNRSSSLVHEVIVVRTATKNTDLPYSEKQARVIESRIRRLGEISDLKPGATGTLTLNLQPGQYMLICNQPGHYRAGMKVRFEVD
jgi:uncharacterized cupredoxin-like copper-binding protein